MIVSPSRRQMLTMLAILAPAALTPGGPGWAQPAGEGASGDFPAAWAVYRRRFVRLEGRVVDSGNGGVSHTEGQGWGMLFAEAAGDRESFDSLWNWTQNNLRRPEDGLFSWRWQPDATPPVPDRNNASDGDLLIAWALLRAGRRWQNSAYQQAALELSAAIQETSLLRDGKKAVRALLPARQGFQRDGGTIVNLSYFVFPAFRELAAAEKQAGRAERAALWQATILAGLSLLRRARFGTYQLPPDWLFLGDDGELFPAPDFPPRFGYEAVRIPLYLAWAGLLGGELATPYRTLWAQSIPGWVNLHSDAQSDYQEHNGFRAVAALVLPADHLPLQAPADGVPTAEDNYYSASLLLLAALARREQGKP
ncbi:glycosyl hydrolase family 8 [Niveispirillum sp. BGYR6]|uniref:glycosyl hydrolase family 8 n=1 Tax=Niveispirillum sp. BGYR6 TaxID=2971249 RepID=UPI0022B9794E|nr:glycosyl hydrolase family 8 [Niveispirillum sp. BGYR6]MDG5497649.1 glycosyl hydrolase family 8 [Niveispirillum sp. BGYR6]